MSVGGSVAVIENVSCVEDLEVYKKAHKLTLDLYKITDSFPNSERFGLISQIRRAAISINANLMEGNYRLNRKEFRQFVGIARGSAGELKYHLLVCGDLGLIGNEVYLKLNNELISITKMLFALAKSLQEEN